MLPSRTESPSVAALPFSTLYYQQIADLNALPEVPVVPEVEAPAEVRMTEEAWAAALEQARLKGKAEAEAVIKSEYETKAHDCRTLVNASLVNFKQSQKEYFSRVESEVVQLALSIAAKILHREAQVDPLLVAALVQIALGQLKEGSAITVRVRPEEASRWRKDFSSLPQGLAVNVLEDSELASQDCIVETELGTANFSLDAQLKEIERGFFDVLAQKPQI